MKEYEILIETINPCGGESHAKKEIIEAECESPEAYVKEKATYPIMDNTKTATGDALIITGDGNRREATEQRLFGGGLLLPRCGGLFLYGMRGAPGGEVSPSSSPIVNKDFPL